MDSYIPIIVGITGHRNISQKYYAKLEKEICDIFKELKTSYPKTPIILLTPLAEGADRIAAGASIKSNVDFIVPLPMEKEEYCNDFQTKASKEEFSFYLSKAKYSYEIPLLNNNEERDKKYEEVGIFIARHCHILIALWDGLKGNGRGGTEEIVNYKLKGIPKEYVKCYSELDNIDNGPVYHIVTPRDNSLAITENDIKLSKIFPQYWSDKILFNMNEFNKDIVNNIPLMKEKVQKSKSYLLPQKEQESLSISEKAMLQRYAIADVLSLHFQNKKQKVLKACLFLGALVVTSFLFYDEVWQTPILLITYLFSIILAYLWCYANIVKNYQSKYLDYRALAEGLRIQFFWELTGIQEDVSEYYLNMQKGDMEWIRNAIRSLTLIRENKDKTNINNCKNTFNYWVIDQYNFFKKSKIKNENMDKKLSSSINVLFILNIAVVILLLMVELLKPELLSLGTFNTSWHGKSTPVSVLSIFKVILGISAALIAATSTYSDKLAFGEQSKRYFKMEGLFGRVIEKLKEYIMLNDIESCKNLIMELGKESLEENGDWVLMFREKPIEGPKG